MVKINHVSRSILSKTDHVVVLETLFIFV